MIKFFRKIRQNLLMENKTSKYFKYAIGEIILVVIGILIALQINNWNEDRKQHQQAIQYLKEFKKDLQSDTLQFNYMIRLLEVNVKAEDRILRRTKSSKNNVGDIIQVLTSSTYLREINQKTFQKIQNAGNGTLLGFEALYDELSDYYIETNRDLRLQTRVQSEQYKESIAYFIAFMDENNYEKSGLTRGLTDIRNEEPYPVITKNQPQNFGIEFINTVRGRNFVREAIVRHSWADAKYKT
tara:strand:+ start:36096 stop:36818 length:723 start_codon:yes stop_codon:yes gene_type:complete